MRRNVDRDYIAEYFGIQAHHGRPFGRILDVQEGFLDLRISVGPRVEPRFGNGAWIQWLAGAERGSGLAEHSGNAAFQIRGQTDPRRVMDICKRDQGFPNVDDRQFGMPMHAVGVRRTLRQKRLGGGLSVSE